jgi:hypothetical protein
MFVESIPLITQYISELADELHQRYPKQHLSGIQKKMVKFLPDRYAPDRNSMLESVCAKRVGFLSRWRTFVDLL